MADAGAYLFLLVLFGVLFGLPIWLMIRHHKKSKEKLDELNSRPVNETPKEVLKRQRSHYESIFGVIGIAVGVLIGSQLLGNILVGFVLGILLAVIGALIASVIRREEKDETDE